METKIIKKLYPPSDKPAFEQVQYRFLFNYFIQYCDIESLDLFLECYAEKTSFSYTSILELLPENYQYKSIYTNQSLPFFTAKALLALYSFPDLTENRDIHLHGSLAKVMEKTYE